jgi:hypothetical protein
MAWLANFQPAAFPGGGVSLIPKIRFSHFIRGSFPYFFAIKSF